MPTRGQRPALPIVSENGRSGNTGLQANLPGGKRSLAETLARVPKPAAAPEQDLPSPSGELETLKDLFRTYYYFSDDTVIDLVLGIVAGNAIDSDSLWLHLISAPSGGKTELLYSIFDCPETYFLSDFTANTLISGYKDPPAPTSLAPRRQRKGNSKVPVLAAAEATPAEEYSLLPKLDGKTVVTKDFSLIHDKPSETRSQIFSVLRDVYDGYASKGLGNSATKAFHSKFNYITGMTPDIEKSWSLNTLGERFLMYRISIEDPREHARRAFCNAVAGGGTSTVRKSIQAATKAFLEDLPRNVPTISTATVEAILDLGTILSTLRTYVYRDRNDEIPCLPQPELAARVSKQLLRVGQSVAMVRRKGVIGRDEIALMKRIALDSLPTTRRHLLNALWEQRGALAAVEAFTAVAPRLSATTVRRELENMVALEVVDREDHSIGGKRPTAFYRIGADLLGCCERAGGIPLP